MRAEHEAVLNREQTEKVEAALRKAGKTSATQLSPSELKRVNQALEE